ncbi:biogenesis of lysosome-related organelles complex 1 subunit 1-like [Teleopsis dalmanni]|uniref:biogenesis of lysosome-related organelles complex 1 subunit 1-like n=1 Tax=Teleopsis dalmanni TaxID=139649 RepID=UPI0018CEFA46|nr:biogenesis of lysosome-related organelles complex 1 subunit 1-like [Teleopsis dalmanni]XP_037944839.1 biogenesis of lysosome-related organelles complex 1 subunit 1-like [Teleopsis dalmanni]XP_037944854.1 biogenesis of lysosome-related organelles complex 1 subunit 1-like [Teleopsis dalmanni]
MLSSMVKEHHARQAKRKQEQEVRRKEAIEASNEVTQALVDHLNVGVAQAYLNQKRLDAEAKQLHVGATNFAKQTQQWLNLIDNFSSALKELGDVENWARSIEDDMKIVQGTLEIAYKTSRQIQNPKSS